ncbi:MULTISPECIES: small hydrophobic protein [Streptomyces]|uniref:Small hydrophobic protein n=1 Tax=Streptomyces tauricus TaxID=68274 RepID=A0ABZ1JNX7_9ACTN|nr:MULTISPECIES: small hydrophobic protein [Streptomyces]MCW8099042.1 small hydrophobic protein [Streptomyces tauricus]UPZ31462.1 small hydrophobic protein [Streptomyces sp. LRE541]
MMAGYSHTSRKHPRSRSRTRSRSGPDSATLGIIGVICAVAGFFVLGIILGPAAIVCGWLAMGRRWNGARPVTALIAVVLGAIDTVLAIVLMIGMAAPGGMMF